MASFQQADIPDVEPEITSESPKEQTVSSMSGNVMKLATSRAIVVAISMAAAPILSRLFPPESFGVLSILTTLISILAAFGTLSYVRAIPITTSADERRDLCVLCLAISIVTTIIVVIPTLAGADVLAKSFNEPNLTKYVWFLPFLFLGQAVWQLGNMTLGCERRFGVIAWRNIMEGVVTRSVQLGSCLVGLLGSPFALIIGTLAGSCASVGVVGVASIKRTIGLAEKPLSLDGVRATAAKFRKFPLISLWNQTINALTVGLPVMILGIRFSVDVAGLYGMAFTLVNLPFNLFAAGVNQIFHVEAGDRVAQSTSAAGVAQQLVRMVAVLTAFPLAVLLLLGPLLFELFLGQQWYEAGVFAQILAPWLALVAFMSPLSSTFSITNRQGESFLWNIALLIARFSTLYFGGMFFGVRATLGLFVAASVVIVAWLVFRLLNLLGVSRRWAAATIGRAYVESFALLAPAGIAYWYFQSKIGALVLLGTACAVHAYYIHKRHPHIANQLIRRIAPWMRWGKF